MNDISALGTEWCGGLVVPGRADALTLARLTPLLTRSGLTVELIAPRHMRPVLVVANTTGTVPGPATTVYIADHPEPAVYGFSDLYLGPIRKPERVAARLAWLLGVPARQQARSTPTPPGKTTQP